MTDEIDWDRLARYVSGESGPEERAEVERWAATASSKRAALDLARRRWDAARDRSTWDVDAAWLRTAPRLRGLTVERRVVELAPAMRRSRWSMAARLVPLVAAAGLVIALALQFRDDASSPTTATQGLAAAETRTGIGEQRTIDLVDGSQVILGAASSLRLAEGFGSTTREVFLEGQAYLKVRHDATSPFIVHAGGTRTVDLGTAFEVRAYPNEGVRVAVTEGEVEVRRPGGSVDSTVLHPGDIADVPVSGATVVRRQQDVERLLGWTRGQLVFDDTPLSEVARTLERWFDVQVRVEDAALRDLHFSVELRIGEGLDEILKLVEISLSSPARAVRAERNGNVVTFRSGPPGASSPQPSASRSRVEAGA